MSVRLHIRPTTGAAYEFSHAGSRIRLGRNPESDLHFADADNVSWDHAELTISQRATSLTDLGSTNGTYLNGKQDRLKSCVVKLGDEFRLGVTGPQVRILELNSAGQASNAPDARIPKAVGVAPPPDRPVSVTRKLLIDSQSRNRTMLAALAGLFLILIVLISGIVLLVNRKADDAQAGVDRHAEDIGHVKKRQDRSDDIVGDIADKMADLSKGVNEFQEVAKRHDAELAAIKPKLDDMQRDALRRHQELREAFAKKEKEGKGDSRDREIQNLGQAMNGRAMAAGDEPPLELKPNMLLSIRKRGSAASSDTNYKDHALAYATNDRLELVGFDTQHTISVKFDDIETIFVKDQMYRLNRNTGQFEPGLDFYQLDISGIFQRVSRSQVDSDLEFFERGALQGESVTRCFVQRTGQGLVIVLPRGMRSISFPAQSISKIVTNKGEYEYVDDKKDYRFTRGEDIAKAAWAEQRRKWTEQEEKEWGRKKEAYKLVTERLRSLRWWNWWPPQP